MCLSTIHSVFGNVNLDSFKAHEGPITFIKPFLYINPTAPVFATGSHDKNLKFWSAPNEWLEFKKQAKATYLARYRADENVKYLIRHSFNYYFISTIVSFSNIRFKGYV